MNTNSALIVPAQPPDAPATGGAAADLKFQEAVKPLIDIRNPWVLLWWTLGVIAALVAGYFLWRWWRRRAAIIAAPKPVPPHIRARRLLEQALSLISEPKEFSIAVSGTIRIYLEERFNFHAPDRTTDEFLYELQSSDLLTPEQKQSLAEFLASCDLIKFAKYEPTEVVLLALHAAALRLVNETEPRLVPSELQSTVAQ